MYDLGTQVEVFLTPLRQMLDIVVVGCARNGRLRDWDSLLEKHA